ncbi:MAG: ATP-binding protein, partial [Oceanococcaceae bacterium]
MKIAPELPEELPRCAALHALEILDTVPEERFDRLTRLAQKLFGTRIALVSLVDQDRQWFKSRQGLDAEQTERSISFCGHAIASDRLFVVEDTHSDERFADNPLVLGAPHIRFYAGCPLRSEEGFLLGTLCVIDDQPRCFSDSDRESLRALGRLVEEELATEAGPSFGIVPQDCPFTRAYDWVCERLSSRRAAVAAALVVASVVLLIGISWDQAQSRAHFRNTVIQAEQNLELMGRDIRAEFQSRLQPSVALGAFISGSQSVSQAEFSTFAQRLMASVSGLKRLQWSPQLGPTLSWPEDQPLELSPHLDATEARLQARWRVVPKGGMLELEGHFPVRRTQPSQAFKGWASVVVDLPAVLSAAGFTQPKGPMAFALQLGAQQSPRLRTQGSSEALFAGAPSRSLMVGGQSWTLSAAPRAGWPQGWPRQQSFRWMLLGLVILVGGLVFQMLRMPAQTRHTIRRAVAELEGSQTRFRDAIQTLPAGFVIFDREDQMTVCNDRFREIYPRCRPRLQAGRSFEEIVDYGLSQGQYAIAPRGNSKAQEDLREILLQRHSMPSSAFDLQTGEGRWVRVVESRMQDGGTVSFHLDVTDQKQVEKGLIDARLKAEQANQAKTTFLATVSHEVRTPLNGVIGLLSVLADASDLSAAHRSHIQTAQDSARHLLALLNEILDISKMEAGKLQLELTDFTICQMVGGAVDLVRAQAEAKGLDFRLSCDSALQGLRVHGDEARLRQVLLNLLSNAVKFTDSGFVHLRARADGTSSSGQSIVFEVEDSGIGFEPAHTEQLFRPFEQLDGNAARRFSGTGLGLAISRRLMDMMGGRIEAEGRPGAGATPVRSCAPRNLIDCQTCKTLA